MEKYGYIRVSSKDQNTDRQYESLLKYGVKSKNIFIVLIYLNQNTPMV